MDASDLKLITSVIVIVILWIQKQKIKGEITMINISNIKRHFYSALGEEKAIFNGLKILEINQGDFYLSYRK